MPTVIRHKMLKNEQFYKKFTLFHEFFQLFQSFLSLFVGTLHDCIQMACNERSC